jgi:drug/metabolite transporter (DMT)-like permease
MGILFALLAGIFMPLTNLTVRKSVDIGGTTKGYFVFQLTSSFLFALLLGPIRTGDFSFSPPAILLGVVAGLLLSLMLLTLGRAIEKGPPGFTFAILNSATVMPGLVMALIFGSELGYIFNFWHGLGSLVVLMGLFWAGKGLQGMKETKQWLLFSFSMFTLHVLLLSLYQWRGFLLKANRPIELFPFFPLEQMKSEWFTPCMFLTAALIQGFIYLTTEKRKPKSGEISYGFAGGLSNLLVTFCLLAAAQIASPVENAIIYPVFSVVGIILTNAWGQKLYQEQVNWRACQLSAFGLILGTVDWKAVAAAIGF